MPCGAGDQPQQDLRLAELRVVRGDPEVGAERELAAAAQGVTGDGRDHGLGDARHGGEGLLEGPGAYDHRRVVHGLHLLDVRARREHLLAAVEDHRAHVLAPPGLLGELAQPVLDGDVQSVHGRPVQPDGADVVVYFEGYGHGRQVNRR